MECGPSNTEDTLLPYPTLVIQHSITPTTQHSHPMLDHFHLLLLNHIQHLRVTLVNIHQHTHLYSHLYNHLPILVLILHLRQRLLCHRVLSFHLADLHHTLVLKASVISINLLPHLPAHPIQTIIWLLGLDMLLSCLRPTTPLPLSVRARLLTLIMASI